MNMLSVRFVVVPCALLAACTGTIAGNDGTEAQRGGLGGGGGTSANPSCQLTRQAAPLRRLTRTEYANTVRDLLGISTTVSDSFEPDTAVGGFASNGIATISASGLQDYADAASTLAAQADLAKILPCETQSGNDDCARKFITNFGSRALRRPLAPSERDSLFKVYAGKKTRSDFASAARLVIEVLLQSPSFLYRPDVASSDDSEQVARSYELASRLSYFLWSSMPDERLFASAQSGSLLAKPTREAEVRRMLADPRSNASIRSFYYQWLNGSRLTTANKDEKLFPEFQAALKASMREETARFVEHVYANEKGSLKTLLTAPFGFVDAALSKVYGVAAPANGFQKTDLPAGQRAGLLTQAGFLATHAFAAEPSPIHRGLFVRRKMLCQELALPPNTEIKPPEIDPKVSIRERLAQHRADARCAGCHAFMDPIGFGFGHYDAIGRWQTTQGNFPVDAEGELLGTDEIDGRFKGTLELAGRLADSAIVQRCMAQQWFTFALGREVTEAESCLIDDLALQLRARALDMRELIVGVATSDAFALSHTK